MSDLLQDREHLDAWLAFWGKEIYQDRDAARINLLLKPSRINFRNHVSGSVARFSNHERAVSLAVGRGLFYALILLICSRGWAAATASETAVTAVASLCDPAKLATLKTQRAANARLLKALAWLEEARRAGKIPSQTIDEAQKLYTDTPAHAALVKESLLRNYEIAGKLNGFTPKNLDRMKSGHAPLIAYGNINDEPVEVDHVLPVAIFPQLSNDIANLWLLSRLENRRKSDAIRQRAIDLGRKMVDAKLITEDDLNTLRRMH